jgi:hypothetical protein
MAKARGLKPASLFAMGRITRGKLRGKPTSGGEKWQPLVHHTQRGMIKLPAENPALELAIDSMSNVPLGV